MRVAEFIRAESVQPLRSWLPELMPMPTEWLLRWGPAFGGGIRPQPC